MGKETPGWDLGIFAVMGKVCGWVCVCSVMEWGGFGNIGGVCVCEE